MVVFYFGLVAKDEDPGPTTSRFHKYNAVKSLRLPRRHLCRANPSPHWTPAQGSDPQQKGGTAPVCHQANFARE